MPDKFEIRGGKKHVGKGLANRVGLNMGNSWNTGIGDCTCTAGRVVSEQSYWSVV